MSSTGGGWITIVSFHDDSLSLEKFKITIPGIETTAVA
jgi:hypothetical protein